MPFVSGFLKVRSTAGIDNELPGAEGPTDPGYGIEAPAHPWIPGHLPHPPVGVWPPPNSTLPIVPAPPGTPPGAIWPSPGNPPIWSGGVIPPVHVGGGPAPGRPARPDAGLPAQPGHPGGGPMPGGEGPDAGLPMPQVFWIVAGIPGVGWRYVCVDPSLVAGTPLPPAPEPK